MFRSHPRCFLMFATFAWAAAAASAPHVQEKPAVRLQLTQPAGHSPQVFTEGWVFGARCVVNLGGADERDLSGSVRWSGSGAFQPAEGALSRPTFAKPGQNTIELTVTFEGQRYRQSYQVVAIDPSPDGVPLYAAVGDRSKCAMDAHSCPACPHPVVGPIVAGSPTVTVRGLPAARKGDNGVATPCCGANTYAILEGDASVLIDGRPAARIGDETQHCGGRGRIVGPQVGYYAVFQLTVPGVKEGRAPKRSKEETDEAWERRRRETYAGLGDADFQFEEFSIEQYPFVMRVSGAGLGVYPREQFAEGSRLALAVGGTFLHEEKTKVTVAGALLLTARGTFSSFPEVLGAHPSLEGREESLPHFSTSDGRSQVNDQSSSLTLGPLTADWSADNRQQAVQLMKTILLYSDCFVAHAVYRETHLERVDRFRRFRDEVLLQSRSGARLVRLYYEYGPAYADVVGSNASLRRVVRAALDITAGVLAELDWSDPNVRAAAQGVIFCVDQIAARSFQEGGSRGIGQFTRVFVPRLWAPTSGPKIPLPQGQAPN